MQEKDERSIGELFSELSRETTELFRQEVQLAKAEMSQKASRVGKNVGFLVVGGVVAYTGVLALVAAGIILLGQVIPYWLSAGIVGLVIALVGLFLVVKGANTLRQEKLDPETLKEEAKTRAKGTARDTGTRVVETAKQNPTVPVAVAGGLLGLLLVRRWLRGSGHSSEAVVVDLKRG